MCVLLDVGSVDLRARQPARLESRLHGGFARLRSASRPEITVGGVVTWAWHGGLALGPGARATLGLSTWAVGKGRSDLAATSDRPRARRLGESPSLGEY